MLINWFGWRRSHQGSWATAQSYNTVVVEFAYTNETIRNPDAHMLRLVLEETKSWRAECHGMRDEINELTVALAEVTEDEPKERNAYAPHKKREMKTAVTNQEDLDDRIRDKLFELKEKGVPEAKRRYPKGVNRTRYIEYEKRKRATMQPILPNDYVPRKVRAENETKKTNHKRKHEQTPDGPDPMKNYSVHPEGKYDSDGDSEPEDPVKKKTKFNTGRKHAWIIPSGKSENDRRQWLKRAKEIDGREVENGGLIEDADCKGPRKVIHVGPRKERIECVEN